MKQFIFLIATVLSVLFFANCNHTKTEVAHKEILQLPNWFVGTWQNKTVDGTFTENWIQANDTLYSAISTVIVGNDTVFYEQINLQNILDEWHYIVSVKNQSSNASVINSEKPVAFKLSSATATQLIFDNPEHDFPTKITYTQINNDSIVADISGIVKGNLKKEIFPMKRIK